MSILCLGSILNIKIEYLNTYIVWLTLMKHIFDLTYVFLERLITRENKINVRGVFNFLKVFDVSDNFLIFKCSFEIFRNFSFKISCFSILLFCVYDFLNFLCDFFHDFLKNCTRFFHVIYPTVFLS